MAIGYGDNEAEVEDEAWLRAAGAADSEDAVCVVNFGKLSFPPSYFSTLPLQMRCRMSLLSE